MEDVRKHPDLYPSYQLGHVKSTVKGVKSDLRFLMEQVELHSNDTDMIMRLLKNNIPEIINRLDETSKVLEERPEQKNEMDLSVQQPQL